MTLDPKLSQTKSLFPRPTTKASSSGDFRYLLDKLEISSLITSSNFSLSSSFKLETFFKSIVIYVPFFFPKACSPASFKIFTLVIFASPFFSSSHSKPEISSSNLFAFLYKSRLLFLVKKSKLYYPSLTFCVIILAIMILRV